LQPISQDTFQAVRKTRVTGVIIEQIRELITSGRLKSGDRLPAERDLAVTLGVGRPAVREAIRALETLGILETRAGEGTFVAATPANQRRDPITATLFQAWNNQRKLFEVRRVLEPGLAALAARRASPEQIEKMRAILDEQARKVQKGESYMKEDSTFHYLVAEATGNEILLRVADSLMELLEETRDTSQKLATRPSRSLRQHQVVLDAIEARKPLVAERRMREHILGIERLVFSSELQTVGTPASTTPAHDAEVAP
jgi:GntR family transcriptional regulator, transcriptional repressor for pyruvate dehydrogenase complex